MSIPCTFGDDHPPASVLMTWLYNGASVNMCPEDVPVGLINILATDLGVDPGKFYEYVKRFVDREAKKAAADAQQDTDGAGSTEGAAVVGESTGPAAADDDDTETQRLPGGLLAEPEGHTR